MNKKYFLGVDIGTYESRGVIIDLAGNVVCLRETVHDVKIPKPGWMEHDAEKVWWGGFVKITKDLLRDTCISSKDILAIGCSGILASGLPVDNASRPIRDGCILYGNDTRSTEEINELEKQIGYEEVFRRCGNTLSTQAVGPKILWMKKHEPEIYNKAYKFVASSTFLVARLTGRFVIDHVTAGFWVPLYDFVKQTWSDLCKGIVEPERLPDLAWPGEIAGEVTKEAALETGLAEGTPVIVGSVDAASEGVSVGVVSPGQMMLMYGSTHFIFLIQDSPRIDARLWSVPWTFPGTYSLAACMATSGSITRWFRDQFASELLVQEQAGGENSYAVLAREAAKVTAGSNGLVLLPYFSGERTPIMDPFAKGLYFGLTLAHSRGHLFRAILESMGYAIRHHVDLFKSMNAAPSEIIAVGGGTKNPVWLQAVSDISGLTQKVPSVTVGASYGNAFLAGRGIGVFSKDTDISQWIKLEKTITPNKEVQELYSKYYNIYLELYKKNKDLMAQIGEIH